MTSRDARGFTLIELLVVILILGALLAIVGPNLMGILGRSKIQIAKAQMANLGQAVELFHMEKSRLPRSLDVLTEPDELTDEPRIARIPEDPWDQPYGYRVISRKRYEILCLGEDGQSGTGDDLRHPVYLDD